MEDFSMASVNGGALLPEEETDATDKGIGAGKFTEGPGLGDVKIIEMFGITELCLVNGEEALIFDLSGEARKPSLAVDNGSSFFSGCWAMVFKRGVMKPAVFLIVAPSLERSCR